MKITIITLLAFSFSLTLYSFAKPNAKTFSLAIEVKNLRNEKAWFNLHFITKTAQSQMKIMKTITKL